MAAPLIFISHKHSDRAIANVIRSFITEQSSGKVRVFQSSDPTAEGPRISRSLKTELRDALWEASAVILVYTTPDKDWGYCMWECGVATHPASPDTRIIVLQCADTVPDLFAGQLHLDARQKTTVERFVREFMTDPNFLSRQTEAITGYQSSDPKVALAAAKLYDDLKAVLPEGPIQEWPAHPFFQLQLSAEAAKKIKQIPVENRGADAKQIVKLESRVSDADRVAESLFGMADFQRGLTLSGLFDIWRAGHPAASDAWLDSLADQVGRAAQWQFPQLKWTAMPVSGDRLYAPVLTRVRQLPPSGEMEFDIYMYPFNVLEATPVTSRMVHRRDMFCKNIESGQEETIGLVGLLKELEEKRFSRVPFVNGQDKLVYIAHRSMLDQFITRQIAKGRLSNLDQLTLADVLRDQPDLATIFSDAAAFVESGATLGDAKAAMNRKRDCRDVFVTTSGKPDEPVLGYITDVLIATTQSAD